MEQITQENNPINFIKKPPSSLTNKIKLIIPYVIFGIIIFLVIIGIVLYFRSFSNQIKKTPIISHIPSKPITPTLIPTPILPITLQIPLEEHWIPYNPTCPALKQITIYYPDTWKIGMDGEEDISDIGDGTGIKANECQISFGYPITPGGHQYRRSPGLYGYIVIQSNLSKYKSPSEFGQEKDYYLTNIANRQWFKGINTDTSGFHLTTLYKGRRYSIEFTIWNKLESDIAIEDVSSFASSLGIPEKNIIETSKSVQFYNPPRNVKLYNIPGIDASSSARLFDIGEEFVNKLEFH